MDRISLTTVASDSCPSTHMGIGTWEWNIVTWESNRVITWLYIQKFNFVFLEGGSVVCVLYSNYYFLTESVLVFYLIVFLKLRKYSLM